MEVTFIINEQLPSLNDYINKLKSPSGKHIGAAFKRNIDELCMTYMYEHYKELKAVCQKPVTILFEWHEKSHRRDIDNVYSGKKYILDALQKIGILENDNPRHVTDVKDFIQYGDKDFVEVTIISA